MKNRKNKKNLSRKKKKIDYSGLKWYFATRIIIFFVLLLPLLIIKHYYIKKDPYRIVETKKVVATAYSSDVWQTDDSPCITASGFNVCENGKEEIIANNNLKFGTKVRIPDLYGDRIFTVSDRMNRRYGENRIDLWMTSRDRAVDFGVKELNIEVVEEVKE